MIAGSMLLFQGSGPQFNHRNHHFPSFTPDCAAIFVRLAQPVFFMSVDWSILAFNESWLCTFCQPFFFFQVKARYSFAPLRRYISLNSFDPKPGFTSCYGTSDCSSKLATYWASLGIPPFLQTNICGQVACLHIRPSNLMQIFWP